TVRFSRIEWASIGGVNAFHFVAHSLAKFGCLTLSPEDFDNRFDSELLEALALLLRGRSEPGSHSDCRLGSNASFSASLASSRPALLSPINSFSLTSDEFFRIQVRVFVSSTSASESKLYKSERDTLSRPSR